MAIAVCVDDQVYDEKHATIPVFDRGFLYGDSVYEVARTAGGNPVDLERHLERLRRSAAAISLALPEASHVREAVFRTLKQAQNPDSYIRIMVTRGEGDFGLDPSLAKSHRLVVIVRPLVLPPREAYERGVSAAVVNVRWNLRRAVDPAVKSGNYLTNVMALAEGRKSGAFESIMCNSQGFIAEGASSNVFCVRNGAVLTAPLEDGLLDGITRRRVRELAQECGVPFKETTLTPKQFAEADEAFLTSSVRGLVPITTIDGAPVGDGGVGPVTKRLLELYEAFLTRVAAAEV